VLPKTGLPTVTDNSTSVSVGDQIWSGSVGNTAVLGVVPRDFTFEGVVVTPHDNGRGLWTFGLGLTVDSVTEHVYVVSNSEIGVRNPRSKSLNIDNHTFGVNTVQNSENSILIRAWGGVISVFVNGNLAAEIEGLWDQEGLLSIQTNYDSRPIPQGFVMQVKDARATTADRVRNAEFDVVVQSGIENRSFVQTGSIDQVSMVFQDPFRVSNDDLDFGFRLRLPHSNRTLEVKKVDLSDNQHRIEASITFDYNGTLFWSEMIPLSSYDPWELEIKLVKFGDQLVLYVEGTRHLLVGTNIDFGFDQLIGVEVFTNESESTIVSQDATFLGLPYVRLTGFGVWSQ